MIETLETLSETFRGSKDTSKSPYSKVYSPSQIILSHQIQEHWELYDGPVDFHGSFYNDGKNIGEINAAFFQDTLTFHTCGFRAIDGSVAREILSRAILLGTDLARSRDIPINNLYKYYLLSPNDQELEDWGGNRFKEERRVIDMKYNAIFRSLGFTECTPRNYGSRGFRNEVDQYPMQVNTEQVLGLLKRSWKTLFYENRIKRSGQDWQEFEKELDWKNIEDQWMKNYRESREELKVQGKGITIPENPITLSV